MDYTQDCIIEIRNGTMSNEALKIGEVSKKSGIGIDAIRFYESKGIIKPKSRTSKGYRIYDADVVKTIKFIKDSKELGFTLKEIKEFLDIKVKSSSQCTIVKSKIEKKVEDVKDKIKQLNKIKKILVKIEDHCCQESNSEKCHFLDFL
tara:strand:+ start:1496 stop:1939 length:444 start_codon:yes stop_codon:yes gene_type:complete